jgi:ATP-binding protein involved in chromosome partitioning
VKFRTYHEVTGPDASDLTGQVGRQRDRVRDRLRSVRAVVGVMSGKGGVGKSYVTAALARSLAAAGHSVGVLDADLAGPTAARLLGAAGPVPVDEQGAHPVTGHHGVRVFSTDLLLDEGAPLRWREPASERFVWRSVLEAGAVREFLADVVWDRLDFLLVDLPPGIHRLQDLAELVPQLAGLVAVTIPSEESRRAVARAMRAALEHRLRLLGVVENMSEYHCPHCGATRLPFPGDAGAALAAEFGVPLLARLPIGTDAAPTLDQRLVHAMQEVLA